MAKKVQTQVLNYRVIIEKEYYDDGTAVYSASCPTLGVFDYGNTIDEVLSSIKDGIEGAIEFLTEQRITDLRELRGLLNRHCLNG